MSNREKHNVSFEEAQSVFLDPLAAFLEDLYRSEDEMRGILIGMSDRHRLLFVSFAQNGSLIRIISARLATARERKDHERKGNS